MSFTEFYNAAAGLGDAYSKGLDEYKVEQYRKDAQKLYGQQLDAALASQGQQVPLSALGGGAVAQPQALSALGQSPAPKLPSFAGGNTAAVTMPGSGGATEAKFVGALKEGGLTNPFGLGAMAAYAGRESGYKGSNINGSWSDPSESGQAGTSGGILSWRGDRFANMRRLTAGASDPVVAQAKFALTENPNLTIALQNAKSPEEANQLMANAWKFAGYNRAGGEFDARLGSTRQYVAALGGAPGGGAPAAAPAASGATRMAGSPMPIPQMPQQAQTQPQQASQQPAPIASADDANIPAQGAVPTGFQVPPAQSDSFTPGTVASPAVADPRAASASPVGGVLAPAAAQRITPAQAQNLRAMLANPITQPQAAKIIEGLNKPDEFSFQVVGDQLIRTSKSGRAEVVPNITKPPTFGFVSDKNGNLLVTNPQTGEIRRGVQGPDSSRRDLSLEEKQARGIDPRTFAQVDADGQVYFPGKAATEVNVNQTSEKAQDAKIGGAYGDTFNELQTQGRNAPGQINTFRLMEKLVENPNFYSGTGSNAFLAAKRAAASLGVPGAAEAAAPNELFAKLANQSVVDKLGGSLGSGVSNADVSFITRTTANAENTPEGNRQIIQFGKALAQRQMDVAKLARQYAQGHGGRLDAGFDDQLATWAEAHPLFPEQTAAQKAAVAAQPAPQAQPQQAQPQAARPSAQPVRVSSPDEARRLPSGTPIMLPDGRMGTVP